MSINSDNNTLSSVNSSNSSAGRAGAADSGQRHLADLAKSEKHTQGTQSSNTVPPTCINTYNTRILRVGIDSLYLSYQGELTEENSLKLTELKKLAQSDDPARVALAQIELNGHLFGVSERGSRLFSYVIQNNLYRISIAKLGAKLAPLAYVQVSSELLTKKSLELIIDDLSAIVEGLGSVTEQAAISRVDICADFVTKYHLFEVEDQDWVTRADDIHNYSNKRTYSGTSIGAGGDISARLYNKTLEMLKKPRPYLEELYLVAGWSDSQDVWRLEFQFMRDSLRSLGLHYISDLKKSLSGLWNYATFNWLRHTVPNPTDQTQSRWHTSEWWEVMQSADWGEGDSLSRLPVDKGRVPSDKSLFVNGISGLTSFMARESIIDPYEGASLYLQSAKEYHDKREHITGLDFMGYIQQKVSLKIREYGTAQNQPQETDIHPANKRVADAYRKSSDGE